jgi:hypothetical protein
LKYINNTVLKILRNKYIFRIIPLYFFLISCNGLSQVKCGTERWSVKTLSDRDTLKINFYQKVRTTVHEQVSLPKPAHIAEDLPRMQSETTLYVLDCWLVGYKKEKDKDIHMIIKDLSTGETMVAEIPSAYCFFIQKTSRYNKFVILNQWFLMNIGKPASKFTYIKFPLKVQITGVGFYDFLHGQKGMAPNGREIHPVLEMSIPPGH